MRTTGAITIATTRPFGGVSINGADWHIAEVAPLTQEQQSQLCRKWFNLEVEDRGQEGSTATAFVDQQVADFVADLSKSRDLQELAEVPLLLVSLIAVHLRRGVLPTDRFSAFDQLVTYLIQEHPTRRRAATLNTREAGFAPLRDDEVRLVFSYIAFSIHPETVVAADRVLKLVEEFLTDPKGLGLDFDKLQARAIAEQFTRIAEGTISGFWPMGLTSLQLSHISQRQLSLMEWTWTKGDKQRSLVWQR